MAYSNLNGGNNGYIKGIYKKFDQALCDKYDLPAREKVKEKMGDHATDNPDLYEQDLLITGDKRFKFMEIQVCGTWETTNFPKENIQIFVRKARYGIDTVFLTLSKDLKRGYLFSRESFQHIKPTRVVKYSKMFVFEIPLASALFIYTDYLNINTLKLVK
jgi:hypothetical protein